MQGGTPGTLPRAAYPNLPVLPAPKPVCLAPNQRWANLCSVSGSCCSQEEVRPGALLQLSEGVAAAASGRGASCALQPACTFSCFVLKYPLVSFFTSYRLYPKLCISPLNGVIFLIAGRILLLDTSLLLVRSVALQRAR